MGTPPVGSTRAAAMPYTPNTPEWNRGVCVYRDDESQFNILKLDVHKPVKVTPFLAESTQVTLEEALLSGLKLPTQVSWTRQSSHTRQRHVFEQAITRGLLFCIGAWQGRAVRRAAVSRAMSLLDQQAMSVDIMKQYLSSGSIKGVGPSTARKIVDALDEGDLRHLFKLRESGEETNQVDTTISKKLIAYPGFGKKTVNTIMNGMRGNHNERQIYWAAGAGF